MEQNPSTIFFLPFFPLFFMISHYFFRLIFSPLVEIPRKTKIAWFLSIELALLCVMPTLTLIFWFCLVFIVNQDILNYLETWFYLYVDYFSIDILKVNGDIPYIFFLILLALFISASKVYLNYSREKVISAKTPIKGDKNL